MFLSELFNEAVMSSTVQARAPVSPGARGLVAGKFNFIKSRNAALGDNNVAAVEVLRIRLIDSIDYKQADQVVTSVAEEQNMTTEQLKKLFRTKYGSDPRIWLKNYMVKWLNTPKGLHESKGFDDSRSNWTLLPLQDYASVVALWTFITAPTSDYDNRQYESEDKNKWLLDNFEIVNRDDLSFASEAERRNAWYERNYEILMSYHSGPNAVIPKNLLPGLNDKILKGAQVHKNKIISNILKYIKQSKLGYLKIGIEFLQRVGVNWPELEIIKKSLESKPGITESNNEVRVPNDLHHILDIIYWSMRPHTGSYDTTPSDFRLWLRTNFNIRENAWMYISEQELPALKTKIADFLNLNKRICVVNILKLVQRNAKLKPDFFDPIRKIVNWPELDIIKNSLSLSQNRKSDPDGNY